MGLLNHLFGNKKSIAKELMLDDDKRMALWNEHLANFDSRERLCKHFNYGNVDKALRDFVATKKVLEQLEALISPELVDIADEEKNDEEILVDLNKLKSNSDLDQLFLEIVSVRQDETGILKLFQEIFKVLQTELHLIRVIRTKPRQVRELLLELFQLIFHREARLYKVFKEQFFSSDNIHIHHKIVRIAHAIILEQELKEELESDEEKFARKMVQQMAPDESKRQYRKLGEAIYFELTERAGAPFEREKDLTEAIQQIEALMKDDQIMFEIVKKLRPKYDNTKIKAVILAFRQAYDLGHFIDLEGELAT